MLVNILHELLGTCYAPAREWLCNYLGVDYVDHVSVQDSQLCITQYNNTPKHQYMGNMDIFSSLNNYSDKILSTRLVWFMLRHSDVYDETNDMVHDYIVSRGIKVERIPFMCQDEHLVLTCDKLRVKKPKRELSFRLVGTPPDKATLYLPLTMPTLQNLLFGRLRRYADAQE